MLVVAALVACDRARHVSPDKQLPLVITACGIAWLITSWFTVHVALRHIGVNLRGESSRDGRAYECNGLVWYLLLLPPITAMTACAQLLATWTGCSSMEPEVPMGRMIGSSPMQARVSGGCNDDVPMFIQHATQPIVRVGLLVAEALVLLFGALRLTFWPAGRDRCGPEVWWTSTVIVHGSLMFVVFLVVAGLGRFVGSALRPQNIAKFFQRDKPLVDICAARSFDMAAMISPSCKGRPIDASSVHQRYDARMAALTTIRAPYGTTP